jgi:hypothetical protein
LQSDLSVDLIKERGIIGYYGGMRRRRRRKWREE